MMHETKIAGNANYNFAAQWLPSGVVFSHGSGSRLWDTQGNEWLDFYCNFGANIVGHGNEQYVSAISRAMMRQSSVVMSDLGEAAAEKICAHVPSMERIRFAMTGTEVAQTAFRLSRAYTGRRKIMRFTGHYHGHSDNILGGTYDGVHDYPVILEGDTRASRGTIADERINETLIVPWNDTAVFRDVVSRHHSRIACIIMEPLNMNGGAIHVTGEFLDAVTRACRAYGIVLIFDEIITINRTGIGGMQQVLGVRPDLTLLGKTLAGGALPVSAIGGREEIMSLLTRREVVQAGTFNGYHAGMAAVLAAYELLEAPGGLERMFRKGHDLRRQLEQISREEHFPVVAQGCDGCFCLHPGQQALTSPAQWTGQMRRQENMMQEKFFRRHVCVAPPLRFYLNTGITDEEIGALLDAARSVFREMAALQPGTTV